jgi:hypothetical protein
MFIPMRIDINARINPKPINTEKASNTNGNVPMPTANATFSVQAI